MRKIYSIALGLALSLSAYSQNALDFDGIDDKVDVGNPAGLQISGKLKLRHFETLKLSKQNNKHTDKHKSC